MSKITVRLVLCALFTIVQMFNVKAQQVLRDVTGKIPLFDKGIAPVSVKDIHMSAAYGYMKDSSGVSTGLVNNIKATTAYDLGFSLMVTQLPFSIGVAGNNGMYEYNQTPLGKFPSFNFNHQEYLEQIQKNVLKKINPEEITAATVSRIKNIKDGYENSLRNEIWNIQKKYKKEYDDSLHIDDKVTDLSVTDLTSLKKRLMPEDLMVKYKDAVNGEMAPGSLNDSLKNEKQKVLKKYESLQKVYEQILSSRKKYENNEVVNKLKENLPFKPDNYKEYLQHPGQLTDVVKQHTSLTGLQQLFLNITKLDLGTNSLSGGQFDLNNMMNSGINTEFKNKKASVGMIYGSGGQNVNPLLQEGLRSFTTNEYSKMAGVKMGPGWNSKGQHTVSMNFFDFGSSGGWGERDPLLANSSNIASPSRRDAVITYQSSYNVAPEHTVSVDVSKSFGGYRNQLKNDSASQKQSIFSEVFTGSGASNYAAAVDYQGVIQKTTVQFSLKKAGLGYSNPGSAFVRKGETRIGFGLSQKLLHEKLSIKYKVDLRNQNFDPLRNYTYNNLSNVLQFNYRFSRNNRFGFTFRDNSYHLNNKLAQTKTNGYTYSLQGNAFYRSKFRGLPLVNNTILALQRFEIPMTQDELYHSTTWSLNHTSSLVIKSNILSITLSTNQSDNKEYYFNTSFTNAEVNYAYAWKQVVRLSSGIGYYINNGWNKQLGLRQQITTTLFSNMDASIDFNCKKALKIIRSELADQLVMSASVLYKF